MDKNMLIQQHCLSQTDARLEASSCKLVAEVLYLFVRLRDQSSVICM